MKTLVPIFESTAGWSTDEVSQVSFSLNDIPDFVAGLSNTQSLMIRFKAGSNGNYAEIDPSVLLTGLSDIGFHSWSRNKKGAGYKQLRADEYIYQIDFVDEDGTTSYLMPLGLNFNYFQYEISLKTVSKIRITCLHDDDDYLILSHLVAYFDEIPLDLFIGLKEVLDKNINKVYSRIVGGVQNKGIKVGELSGTAGDKKIILDDENDQPFIDRYSVVYIEDNVDSNINEKHQISKSDEMVYEFSSMFDTKELQNTYASASVYVVFEVSFNPDETEILLPGIMIWGVAPEPVFPTSDLEKVRDSMKTDGSVTERTVGQNYDYTITLSCQSRHHEFLATLSNVVKNTLNREFAWINGKIFHINFGGSSSYTAPIEAVNEIPMINWPAKVEVKEELFDRERLVPTTDINTSFDMNLN